MTSALLVLTRHSLRRMRGLLIAVAVLLAAFQFLLTQVAAYLFRRTAFNELAALLPDAFRTLAGPSGLAFLSFSGVVSLGYFHPVVVAALVALTIAITTEPAAEIERRFVDLTLARPLTRRVSMIRTLIVLAFAAALVLLSMTAATEIGLRCCTPADAPRPPLSTIASLALDLLAVVACWGGIAFALGSMARRRAVAAATAGMAALGAYLLDYLGRAWAPAQTVSSVSPFHYFEPMALVTGLPLNGLDIAVLVGVGLVAGGVGAAVYARRDI